MQELILGFQELLWFRGIINPVNYRKEGHQGTELLLRVGEPNMKLTIMCWDLRIITV